MKSFLSKWVVLFIFENFSLYNTKDEGDNVREFLTFMFLISPIGFIIVDVEKYCIVFKRKFKIFFSIYLIVFLMIIVLFLFLFKINNKFINLIACCLLGWNINLIFSKKINKNINSENLDELYKFYTSSKKINLILLIIPFLVLVISNTKYFLIFSFNNMQFRIFTISIWIFSYFFRIVLWKKSVKNIHNYILKNPENKNVIIYKTTISVK